MVAVAPPVGHQVFWDIVEECLDEAEFLWQLWETRLDAHDHTPQTLAAYVEERLHGCMDGLGVAGEAAIPRVLLPAIQQDDNIPRLTAAAYVLLRAATEQGREEFCARFEKAQDAVLAGLRRALELNDSATVLAVSTQVARDAPASVRAALLEARLFSAPTTALGRAELDDLWHSEDPHLRHAAVVALRYTPEPPVPAWIEEAMSCSDEEICNAAILSGLILGHRGARRRCLELAATTASATPTLVTPLGLVAALASAHEHERVVALVADSARCREALWALGFGGRRAGADACVEALRQHLHPKLAADVFCAITGLDLVAERLVEAPPAASEDTEHSVFPEEVLLEPNIAGVAQWWNQHRAQFDGDARYVRGKPFGLVALQEELLRGPMRRRHTVALELAIRSQGGYIVQTRAFVSQQMPAINVLPSVPVDTATRGV